MAYDRFTKKISHYPKYHKYRKNESYRYPQPKQLKLRYDITKELTDNPELRDYLKWNPNFRLVKEKIVNNKDGNNNKKKTSKSIRIWVEVHADKLNPLDSILFSKSNNIYLPKLKWVSLNLSRSIIWAGELNSVTVSLKAGHWYASFNHTTSIPRPSILPYKKDNFSSMKKGIIGLDLGVKVSAMSDTGEEYKFNIATENDWNKLALLQASLSSKEYKSKNYNKAQLKLQAHYKRIHDKKNDSIHKITTYLTQSYSVIFLENLKPVNMTKSAKGTLEKPGKNVAQKSGLNKSILSQSWGEFKRQLEYKAQWSGALILFVDPKHTSQQCSQCGHKHKKNRLNQAEFKCLSCGKQMHADINAAINIKNRGIKQLKEELTLEESTLLEDSSLLDKSTLLEKYYLTNLVTEGTSERPLLVCKPALMKQHVF